MYCIYKYLNSASTKDFCGLSVFYCVPRSLIYFVSKNSMHRDAKSCSKRPSAYNAGAALFFHL